MGARYLILVELPRDLGGWLRAGAANAKGAEL
jgi:hypothetical protein